MRKYNWGILSTANIGRKAMIPALKASRYALVTAVASLIIGMGLPTTATYIVMASLMAVVIVDLGPSAGLAVPLIAAHLFVFYFGIMADVTPPVGLASFAAAAVSGGDPIRTGFTAFFYSLRTVALPFLFIYNPTLILYGVDLGTIEGILQAVFVFVVASGAVAWEVTS